MKCVLRNCLSWPEGKYGSIWLTRPNKAGSCCSVLWIIWEFPINFWHLNFIAEGRDKTNPVILTSLMVRSWPIRGGKTKLNPKLDLGLRLPSYLYVGKTFWDAATAKASHPSGETPLFLAGLLSPLWIVGFQEFLLFICLQNNPLPILPWSFFHS